MPSRKDSPFFTTRAAWSMMRFRCRSRRPSYFEAYGARGIKVCERWDKSFANFLADMGEKPEGMSLDRINNDGNYEPGNCRWATPSEQVRNTRRNRYHTLHGVTRLQRDWEIELGLTAGTIRGRLRIGWTLEEALTAQKGRRP